jgi:hypothetical protein
MSTRPYEEPLYYIPLKTTASGEGTSDHAELDNLDYAHAGHTGFLPATTKYVKSVLEVQVFT